MKNPIINDIPCVLLAGGKSSRFITNNIQTNKALMPFESYSSLLEYQYTRLLKLFKKVIISAKKSYELNVPYLLERESDLFSPLFGIYNAFLTLQTPYIFFIPIDTPLVSFESIKALCGIKNFSLVKNTSSIAMHFNKEEEFLNLNTLKDYELAVQILKERANG
ncbi:molybdenum cofactor guanylyltransferase MobA [Helicobacter pylori]